MKYRVSILTSFFVTTFALVGAGINPISANGFALLNQDSSSTTAAEDAPVFEDREALSFVADQIFQLGMSDGFSGLIVHEDLYSITAFWKGNIPLEIQEYAESFPYGVKIVLNPTGSITRVQGQMAVVRIVESEQAHAFGIVSASVNPDGSGVTISLEGGLSDPKNFLEVWSEISGLRTAEIFFKTNQGAVVFLASRANDDSPWKGGARTIHAGYACSSGFSVLSDTFGRLLSASHCDPSANAPVTDGSGDSISLGGSAVSGKPTIDSLSIDPLASPATSAKIYVGAWASPTLLTVKSWSTNWVNQEVCSSGATTGTHCGKIVDDAVAIVGLSGAWYVRATSVSTFAGGGDSGGPIYKPVTGGVQARGTLIAGAQDTITSCGLHNPDVSPNCYKSIYYLPIGVALDMWGYSLEVG